MSKIKTLLLARESAEARHRRVYFAAVRQRFLQLMAFRYCSHCHLALEEFQLFCSSCGDASEPLPVGYAVAYAQEEFPDLIASRDDFDQIVTADAKILPVSQREIPD